MKEYISKEDLLKRFRYGEADTEDEKVWCATFRRMIKEQPTVTKADICREFAEWLVDKHCLVSPNENERTVEDIINIYLTEMEEE